MSSGESPAAIPPMTGFSRSAFLPATDLKLPSCFWIYSGTWLASFGLAAAGLLPSAPWQAAQTLVAMLCPLAVTAVRSGSGPGSGLGANMKATNGHSPLMSFWPAEYSLQNRLILQEWLGRP